MDTLTLISIFVGIIGIIVTINSIINTKCKKIKLKCNLNYRISDDGKTVFCGITVEAVNISNVSISLDYLGLGWKEEGKMKKVYSYTEKSVNKKSITQSESVSVWFNKNDVADLVNYINDNNCKLYAFAVDKSGKEFKKYYYKLEYLKEMMKDIN